jgi:predicted RNA-binding Zn-ribbon protein involved in translation (DUF1610 family)
MRRLFPSGRAAVWTGRVVALLGIASLVAGTALHGRYAFGPDLSMIGVVALWVGVVVHLVGLSRRADDAASVLAQRRYSWCAGCGYPFDENADDNAEVKCPECGETFRAADAREWYRSRPERLDRRGDT